MGETKKVLFISDYLLTACNSVSDILKSLLRAFDEKQMKSVICLRAGYSYDKLLIDYAGGYKLYRTVNCFDNGGNNKYKLSHKIKSVLRMLKLKTAEFFYVRLCRSSYYLRCNKNYLNKIIKKETPDLIVFVTCKLYKHLIDLSIKHNINYAIILYDTILGNPKDFVGSKEIEPYAIMNSKAYFIPSFFFNEYSQHYKCSNIYSYNLPLLIDKEDVLRAFNSCSTQYEFAYFGQMQSFRNVERIKNIFNLMGKTLHIFTPLNYKSDEIFNVHNAVTGESLYSVVANSKFLVAFDNSVPYHHYLPSKVYLYVSFTKPIIVFGDNKKSALIDFLKDYPYFYYQNINESMDGLIRFLGKDFPIGFNQNLYSEYLQYGKDVALKNLSSIISNI